MRISQDVAWPGIIFTYRLPRWWLGNFLVPFFLILVETRNDNSGVTSICWVIFNESSLPRISTSTTLPLFLWLIKTGNDSRLKIRLTLIWFLWLRMRYLKSGLNKHKSKFNTANGTKHGSRGHIPKCKSGCPELRVGWTIFIYGLKIVCFAGEIGAF